MSELSFYPEVPQGNFTFSRPLVEDLEGGAEGGCSTGRGVVERCRASPHRQRFMRAHTLPLVQSDKAKEKKELVVD